MRRHRSPGELYSGESTLGRNHFRNGIVTMRKRHVQSRSCRVGNVPRSEHGSGRLGLAAVEKWSHDANQSVDHRLSRSKSSRFSPKSGIDLLGMTYWVPMSAWASVNYYRGSSKIFQPSPMRGYEAELGLAKLSLCVPVNAKAKCYG